MTGGRLAQTRGSSDCVARTQARAMTPTNGRSCMRLAIGYVRSSCLRERSDSMLGTFIRSVLYENVDDVAVKLGKHVAKFV